VIVPLVIRLRRTAERPIVRTIARNGSKINISIFLTIVLILGTAPISPMVLDFQSPLQDDSGADVNPDLVCSKSSGEIDCQLSDSTGIDSVVVTAGDREIERVEETPYEFTIRETTSRRPSARRSSSSNSATRTARPCVATAGTCRRFRRRRLDPGGQNVITASSGRPLALAPSFRVRILERSVLLTFRLVQYPQTGSIGIVARRER